MNFKSSPAANLLKELASKYTSLSSLLRSSKKRKWLEAGKPGEIIERLPPEEREKLQTLTSDESQKMLLSKGQIDYICDEYWENKGKEEQEKEYLSGLKLNLKLKK